MPSKAKPLTDTQLRAYEAKRDLAAELPESVRQMKAGKTQVVSSPAVALRVLAQANYAPLSTTDASAITIPTLVVSGQSDIVLGSGPLLAQALAQGKYLEVPGADHFSLAVDASVKAAVAHFMKPTVCEQRQ